MNVAAWSKAPRPALAARVELGAEARVRAGAIGLDLPPGAPSMLVESGRDAAAVFAVDPARTGDEDARLVLGPAPSADLAAETAGLAAATGVRVLTTQSKARDDGATARALGAAGFRAIDTATVYEVAIPAAAASVARSAPGLVSRLGEASGLKLVSLSAIDPGLVAETLDAECLMDAFEVEARRRPGHPRALARDESVAALTGDTLTGFLALEHVPAGEATGASGYAIVARWVAPGARTGLVNLALIVEALARAEAAGVERVRFAANPARHADTFALARRLGATALFTQSRFRRSLTS
ncbi:MAG: hypothetical protein ACFBWO_06765 [Paracoccaceae bacterium]